MSDSPKVHLISLGCPKNTVDSERMLGLLQGNGIRDVLDPRLKSGALARPGARTAARAVMA